MLIYIRVFDAITVRRLMSRPDVLFFEICVIPIAIVAIVIHSVYPQWADTFIVACDI